MTTIQSPKMPQTIPSNKSEKEEEKKQDDYVEEEEEEGKTTTPSSTTSNAIYYPACTWDYYLQNDTTKTGLGIIASRNIKKGQMSLSDSIEFMFSDVVEDGSDYLYFEDYDKASNKSNTNIPQRLHITRDTLECTHGVPCFIPDIGTGGGTITWRLEVPGMLMNHSCNPNIISNKMDDDVIGEDIATRDIARGEELTWDYCLQYYDKGPFFDKCLCGSGTKCRGQMFGFKNLSEELKKELFPKASKAVQAMYLADIGQIPPLKYEQRLDFPTRVASNSNNVLRLVYPGPSYALAPIKLIQQKEEDEVVDGDSKTTTTSSQSRWCLYADKDIKFGDKVYDFWRKKWPTMNNNEDNQLYYDIDLIFSSKLLTNDLNEGTTIRITAPTSSSFSTNTNVYVPYQDKHGNYQFSGWDLFMKHSCEPNCCYNPNEDETDDWHSVYACKNISKGDLLTIDINCIVWDRTTTLTGGNNSGNNEEVNDSTMSSTFVCNCGSNNCVGTTKGYKYLSPTEKEKRRLMTWKHVSPPYDGESKKDASKVGLALSRYIRECWRRKSNYGSSDLAVDSSSCDSSSSSSDDSSDEEED